MKSKKRYLIFGVGIVVIIGIFFGVKQMNSSSLDGTYYSYISDDNGGDYFDKPKIVIKGDKLTFTSDTEGQGDSSWDLDRKNKTMSYSGIASTPFTVNGDLFSFYDQDYVKEGSKTFKAAKNGDENRTSDPNLLK